MLNVINQIGKDKILFLGQGIGKAWEKKREMLLPV
jgi:hypothetical protein